MEKVGDSDTTVFLWDFDGNIIAEYDGEGALKAEYLYRGANRLAIADASGQVYFYQNDRLGTPVAITDQNNNAVWEASYLPFGEAMVNPNSSVENNFWLPGQYFDEETGLHYNYHRYYDPRTGRYVTADPIGLGGGINLYVYVDNNPANIVDPTGESGIPGFVLGIALGATAGFNSGITSGNASAGMMSGVAGAFAGGIAGGTVGFFMPSASPVVGGIAGGFAGGVTAGIVNVRLSKGDCAEVKDYAISAGLGGFLGSLLGAVGGGITSSAARVGVTGAAGTAVAETAASLITMPVGLGADVAFSKLLF